jgi:RNA-directed DNA polymerase
MGEVIAGLGRAFECVAANKGAPGPDRQSIDQVREHLSEVLAKLSQALATGSYRPGEIRRVWIPKAGGGQRGLGIPNVVDRVVQEAVRWVLEPVYEPTFHASSHGFRPRRSCHTAIVQAQEYLAEGREWVVDLDLENFFNCVNHQRLMSRLAVQVQDKSLLRLIGQMLKAQIVMPDGVVVSNDEGVPQGGPLSPLLSNVVLDELDGELQARGHCFVRYADDANIYVKSERAGQRVMASVSRFIEKRLRLKVNTAKSAVAQPQERHFLGFSLRCEPLDGSIEVGLSKRTKERIDSKIRELTPRNWGGQIETAIAKINAYVTGWIGFFGICTPQVERALAGLDAHIRRRLRAMQLKQYKRKRTIVRKLIRFGIKPKTAWRNVYEGRKSLWALSHSPAVDRALKNSHWDALGLKTLVGRYWAHPANMAASTSGQYELAWE